MENAIANLLQLNENSEMTVGSAKTKFTYVSCIKIKGKPILPPLVSNNEKNNLLFIL